MRIVVLLLFFHFISTHLFSQENFIANNVFQWTPTEQEVFSDNESLILATLSADMFGPDCLLRKMDETYQIEKSVWSSSGVAAKTDEQGNIYVLANLGVDYDVIVDPFIFAFRKYDRDLNLLYESSIDTISNPDRLQVNGDFAIVGDQAMIFFQDLRISVDLNSGAFGDVTSDNLSFENVISAQSFPDSTFAVFSSNGWTVMDKEGLIVGNGMGVFIKDAVEKNGLIYGVTNNDEIIVFDNQLEIISEIEIENDVIGINIDFDGQIYIGTDVQLLRLNEDDLTMEVVYENDYHDLIWGGYTFQDELGLVTQEEEQIISQFNRFSANGVRKAIEIDVEALPNLSLLSAEISDQRLYESYEPVIGENAYSYDFDFSIEIKNNSSQVINKGQLQIHGSCNYSNHLNFCDQVDLGNLNISPGETKTVAINNVFMMMQLESTWTSDDFEICMSIINVERSYDANYEDNSDCYLFEISTSTKEVQNNIAELFPNPASNQLFLNIKDQTFSLVEIQVFNMQGELLVQEGLEGKSEEIIELNVSELNDGMYLLKGFGVNGDAFVKRFMVLR